MHTKHVRSERTPRLRRQLHCTGSMNRFMVRFKWRGNIKQGKWCLLQADYVTFWLKVTAAKSQGCETVAHFSSFLLSSTCSAPNPARISRFLNCHWLQILLLLFTRKHTQHDGTTSWRQHHTQIEQFAASQTGKTHLHLRVWASVKCRSRRVSLKLIDCSREDGTHSEDGAHAVCLVNGAAPCWALDTGRCSPGCRVHIAATRCWSW